MATVNLGSIKFKWKGTYSGATAYTVDDVVEYNGSSYICKLASTGNLPTNTTYFDVMSSAGTNGTDLTSTLTTQGDIVYRDGSGLQRLGAGTAGQFLKTAGAGANPIWDNVTSSILQVKKVIKTDTFSSSGGTGTWTDISGLSLNFTPTSTSSWLRLEGTLNFHINGTSAGWQMYNSTDGVPIQIGDTNGNSPRVTARDNSSHPSWSATVHVVAWYQPSSTSQKTYTIRQVGHGGSTVRINFCETNASDSNMDSGRGASSFTIWEYDGSTVS
jgi:hypothetical protein